MTGVLLDTHALIWFAAGEPLSDQSLAAIAAAQDNSTLYVSPISAWEVALASQKRLHSNRPNLGGMEPSSWFGYALDGMRARVVSINRLIALGAADVAATTGHKDPADCLLIATARARRLALVTRDTTILRMAQEGYVSAIKC